MVLRAMGVAVFLVLLTLLPARGEGLGSVMKELGSFELGATGDWEERTLVPTGWTLRSRMEAGRRGRVEIVLSREPGFLVACALWDGPADRPGRRRLLDSVRASVWGRLESWAPGGGARLRLWAEEAPRFSASGPPRGPAPRRGRRPRPGRG